MTSTSRFPIARLHEAAVWLEHFPELSIEGSLGASDPGTSHLDSGAYARIDERMRADGYFQERDQFLDERAPLLARMVTRCLELDVPPPFLFLFDEPWACFYRLHPVLAHVLGEHYRVLPDFWTWHVDHRTEESGWRPHRDKGPVALKPDGTPLSVTVWIPLTESMPLNGCLYLVPAGRDPDYGTANLIPERLDVTSARALPVKPGEWLCWNQAVLHWGSSASRFAPHPRISMALEFQRGDAAPFNQPLLEPGANHPFRLRLQLVAKQILQYHHMYALTPELQALAQRLLTAPGV